VELRNQPANNIRSGFIKRDSLSTGMGDFFSSQAVVSPTTFPTLTSLVSTAGFSVAKEWPFIQPRQKVEAVAFDQGACFGFRLMVGEAFFHGTPRHPCIHARFLGVALWVLSTRRSSPADCRVEQHNGNIAMKLRLITA
jgi:hypothetical protein